MHCVVDCGGDVANEAAHGGAQPVPKKHRVAASTCPDQRGPGSAIVQDWCYGSASAYGVTVLCVQDSDCADGTNGRCLLEGKPTAPTTHASVIPIALATSRANAVIPRRALNLTPVLQAATAASMQTVVPTVSAHPA